MGILRLIYYVRSSVRQNKISVLVFIISDPMISAGHSGRVDDGGMFISLLAGGLIVI